MDRQAQLDFILDHYENPRHYGPLRDATVSRTGANPGCGDVVTIHLRLDDRECVAEISFEGQGCTISMAGASVATELLTGRTFSSAEAASAEEIADLFGRELVATRLKCATLGLNTAKEALQALRRAWR